jgi:ABC-2 type transport system ATP-binding protein
MSYAVEIEQLSKNYGNLAALKDITLHVPAGSIYGLVGSNGAGKTTLIKSLVGALKPTTGKIKIVGLDPVKDRWALRRQIGYMPQAPALYDDLSARRNIMFFGGGQNVKNLEKKTNEILEFAELSERADDLVRTFSGGMKKRVSLCCALMHQPKIIFLDEPTAAIDPHLKLESWNLFRQLAKSGVTLFISTHLMDEALLCDQVTILSKGEIIAIDSPQKILQRGKTTLRFSEKGECHERVMSSTPAGLAAELKQLGLRESISELALQSDTLEDIVLSIINERENPNG